MAHSDALFTIAQIAAEFAGFSGLISILGRRWSTSSGRLDAERLLAMVMASLLAVAFALLPVGLDAAGLRESMVWRLSSGLFALVWAVPIIETFRRIRLLSRSGASFSRLLMATNIAVTFAAISLLLANAFADLGPRAGGIYVLALIGILIVSGSLFARMLLSFFGRTEGDQG